MAGSMRRARGSARSSGCEPAKPRRMAFRHSSDRPSRRRGMGVRAPRRRAGTLLKALIDGGAGIETLAIERPGLHDAFVAIAGDAAAAEMGKDKAHDPLSPLAPSSSPAAISRRPFFPKRSSSFCSARCSRCFSAEFLAASERRVASQADRPVVAVVSAKTISALLVRRARSSPRHRRRLGRDARPLLARAKSPAQEKRLLAMRHASDPRRPDGGLKAPAADRSHRPAILPRSASFDCSSRCAIAAGACGDSGRRIFKGASGSWRKTRR